MGLLSIIKKKLRSKLKLLATSSSDTSTLLSRSTSTSTSSTSSISTLEHIFHVAKTYTPPLQTPRCRNDSQFPEIRWDSVPRNGWTPAQCQHWISSILMHGRVCNMTREDADLAAARYCGRGYSMGFLNEKGWRKILGREAGKKVYRYIMGLQYGLLNC